MHLGKRMSYMLFHVSYVAGSPTALAVLALYVFGANLATMTFVLITLPSLLWGVHESYQLFIQRRLTTGYCRYRERMHTKEYLNALNA